MNLLSTRSSLALVVAFSLLPAVTPAHAQFTPRHIYNENADPNAEIRDAIATAGREHKHIILDFGGNWCGDCQVLDYYFHQQPNAALLTNDFILVDIDIGQMDKNVDVAEKYDVPLGKGVPALAVLDSHGRLLYSQKNGEFEKMRRMDPNSVTSFLEQWKPGTPGDQGGK